jgi:hypothetical protein
MEGILILLSVMIVMQTIKDIFDKIYPTKQELTTLENRLSELEKKHEKIDPDKIDTMLKEVRAMKVSSAFK